MMLGLRISSVYDLEGNRSHFIGCEERRSDSSANDDLAPIKMMTINFILLRSSSRQEKQDIFKLILPSYV